MTDTKTCSKCGGPLEEGFIPDYGHANIALQPCWWPGKVKKSFWTGVQDIRKKPQYPIVVYRCQKCGFLEAYAPHTQSA